MAGQIISFPKVSDAAYLKCVEQLAQKASEYSPNASVHLLAIGNHSFDPQNMLESELITSLVKKNSATIATAGFSAGTFSFTYYRGGASQSKSAFFDEISINQITRNNQNQVNIPDEIILDWISTLCKKLKVSDPNGTYLRLKVLM